MKILHILNGDSTREIFEKTEIDGSVLVWRDVLCEGPCHADFASEIFWNIRSKFMSELYQLDDSVFLEKTISEWSKIDSIDWDEIVLWFEYDLFCQINMMGILSYLFRHFDKKVSLICVGNEEGFNRLVGLGELTQERYSELFISRINLKQNDLEYTDKFWSAYCKNDPTNLLVFLKNESSQFPYLSQALSCHLMRFADSKTGLGLIETTILKYLKSGINSNHSIVGKLLNEEWEYGFGDLQYFNILEKMTDLYHFENGLMEISELGLEVYEGKEKYKGDYYVNEILGGVEMCKFEYDSDKEKLIFKKNASA